MHVAALTHAVLAVVLYSSLVLAVPSPATRDTEVEGPYLHTNAARFARGLSPMKPVQGYDPSRVRRQAAQASMGADMAMRRGLNAPNGGGSAYTPSGPFGGGGGGSIGASGPSSDGPSTPGTPSGGGITGFPAPNGPRSFFAPGTPAGGAPSSSGSPAHSVPLTGDVFGGTPGSPKPSGMSGGMSPSANTNADRFAHGLPPMKPAHGYDPSHVRRQAAQASMGADMAMRRALIAPSSVGSSAPSAPTSGRFGGSASMPHTPSGGSGSSAPSAPSGGGYYGGSYSAPETSGNAPPSVRGAPSGGGLFVGVPVPNGPSSGSAPKPSVGSSAPVKAPSGAASSAPNGLPNGESMRGSASLSPKASP